jgi:ComF family protein
LCSACYQELPWLKNACLRCARPLSLPNLICGFCLKKPPLYQQTLALWHYQPPLAQLLVALKFQGKLIYGHILGELLAEVVAQRYPTGLPELIIPVPLHPQRLKERGYNQALELAKPLKKLGIKIAPRVCLRIKATEPQMKLPAKLRKTNLKNAFALAAPITAQHVAIVDDVVTTGHTVAELCKVLRKAGVQRIDVWCCARSG